MKKSSAIFGIIIMLMNIFAFLSGCKKNLVFGSKYSQTDEHNIAKVNTQPNFTVDKNVPSSYNAFVPASIVADNMVLQRNSVNCLYGTTSFDGPFAVELNGRTFYSVATGGRFQIYLAPMPAGGPYDLAFYSEEYKYTLTGVTVGEVILFSGQSNMMWTMQDSLGMGKQYLKGGVYVPTPENDPETYQYYDINNSIKKKYHDYAEKEIEENEKIVFFNMYKNLSAASVGNNNSPKDDLWGLRWDRAESLAISEASMLGYYFAKRLQKATGMYVGVVMAAWGATNVPAWLPREVYERNCPGNAFGNDVLFHYGNTDESTDANNISRCYNTFIAPILHYKFKAVVWYQGESQHKSYAASMKVLIDAWRQKMDNPSMGFLIIGHPQYGGFDNYKPGTSAAEYGSGSKAAGMESMEYYLTRRQQQLIPGLVENTALSIGLNTGDYDDIHPSDKRSLSRQAADRFMEYFYDAEGTLSGPRVKRAFKDGGEIVIEFENVGKGLDVRNNGINIEVSSDEGKTFREARLKRKSKTQLAVTGTDISGVNYVRYGVLTYPRLTRLDVEKYVSVFNKEGYPSDQFELRVQESK